MNLDEKCEIVLRNCQELENEATFYESLINEVNVELEAAGDGIKEKANRIINENVRDIQTAAEVLRSEILLLKQKRNQLNLLNEDLESKLKMKVSRIEENASNVENDSIMRNETEDIREEFCKLNSEIVKLKESHHKRDSQLKDITLAENKIEFTFKSLENEISEKNKQIDELQCELQLLTEEIDENCYPENLSCNAKSLFSEIEQGRAEGVNEFKQLKESYYSLKKTHEDAKIKINSISQSKVRLDGRLRVSKEIYIKHLQDAISIMQDKNKKLDEQVANLGAIYTQKKDCHSIRKEKEKKTVFDGMISVLKKALMKIDEQKEGQSQEEKLIFEQCLAMKKQLYGIEKKLLYVQNKNATVKVIKDSLH